MEFNDDRFLPLHIQATGGGCQTGEQLCQKDLQVVPVELGGSAGTINWRVSAGTAKVVRGPGEAVALRLVLPGVFSRWLQGGPYSSSPIPMGSTEKMEPGPFVVVYGSRVKHNRHKLHNINEMFRLDRGKNFFSTRTVSATGYTVVVAPPSLEN